MQLSRRGFLKLSGATMASAALAELLEPQGVWAEERAPQLRIKEAQESPTICCYCSVGCGGICSVIDGELVNIEGDPDHPINRGALCAKGAAQFGLHSVYDPETGKPMVNPHRVQKVLYRAPNATEWEEKEWDWAIERIAERTKALRDESFTTTDDAGVTVNRTEALASMGGAALDNEECYLLHKMNRAMGLTYIEHQARI